MCSNLQEKRALAIFCLARSTAALISLILLTLTSWALKSPVPGILRGKCLFHIFCGSSCFLQLQNYSSLVWMHSPITCVDPIYSPIICSCCVVVDLLNVVLWVRSWNIGLIEYSKIRPALIYQVYRLIKLIVRTFEHLKRWCVTVSYWWSQSGHPGAISGFILFRWSLSWMCWVRSLRMVLWSFLIQMSSFVCGVKTNLTTHQPSFKQVNWIDCNLLLLSWQLQLQQWRLLSSLE